MLSYILGFGGLGCGWTPLVEAGWFINGVLFDEDGRQNATSSWG